MQQHDNQLITGRRLFSWMEKWMAENFNIEDLAGDAFIHQSGDTMMGNYFVTLTGATDNLTPTTDRMNKYALGIRYSSDTVNNMQGISFAVNSVSDLSTYTPGASIVFERTGNNSYGKLHFYNKTTTALTSSLSPVMTIYYNSENRVGINTTDPSTTLHVNGNIRITSSGYGAGKILTSDINGLAYWDTSSSSLWALNGTDIYNTNSGNVGIGTISPLYKLDVYGNTCLRNMAIIGSTLPIGIGYETDVASTYPVYSCDIQGGSMIGSNLIIVASGGGAKVSNTHATLSGSGIRFGGVGHTLGVNSISFFSRASGAVTSGDAVAATTARMVIRNNGNVLIGTTIDESNVKLNVYAAAASWVLGGRSNASNWSGLYFDSSNHSAFVGRNSSGTIINWISANGDSFFNGGNIGIGTGTPTNKLHILGGDVSNATVKINSDIYPMIDFYSINTNANNRNWRIASVYNNYGTMEFLHSTVANGTPTTTLMRLDGINARVGIGITPEQKLHVYTSGSNNGIFSETTAGYYGYLRVKSSATYWDLAVKNDEYSGAFQFRYTSGSPQVVINTSGNVGISTTIPSEKLEIGGTSSKIYMNSATSNMLYYNVNGVSAPSFTTRSNGTKIVLYPSVSASAADYGIGIESGTLWLSVPTATASHFFKFYAGTTLRMIIKGDGKVGIGLPSPAVSLDVSGSIAATGEVTAYSTSDEILKYNIVSLNNSLSIIDKLNPVTFKWNDTAKQLNSYKDDRNNFGLIAQELEEVLPELVHPMYEKYKGIDYIQLIPILIQSIKELNNKIKKLENG